MRFEEVKLKDITINYNKQRVPLSGKERSVMNKKYPYYGAQGIIDYVDEFIFDGRYLLVAEDGENLRSRKLNIATIASGKFWVNNHAHVIKNNDRSSFFYLYYLLSNLDVKEYLTGSVQPKLNKSNFDNIILNIPPLNVQRKIGEVLRRLDSKIELNNAIISNLEQLAQTLFKHWFVDFEFPNEDGKPYKSSGGKMVESELGMIPEGWGYELLSNSVQFLSGGTPKTKIKEYWNGEISFFTPKDITGRMYVNTTEKSISSLGLENCNSKYFPKDTLFITARGTVGKLNLANFPMAMNQSCFALEHKNNNQYFLYFLMQTLLREIIQGANGAVFNAINLRDLNSLKIVNPDIGVLLNFENKIQNMIEKISLLEQKNISLSNLRDTLLPKLLSGEIELPDDLEVGEDV